MGGVSRNLQQHEADGERGQGRGIELDWYYGIIDTISSQYSWTLEEVNKVKLGMCFNLIEKIAERKRSEALLELAIVSNPHTQKPELLFNELRDYGSYNPDDKLDRVAMDKLKGNLKKSNLIKVKHG
jgi:hypothetical protein